METNRCLQNATFMLLQQFSGAAERRSGEEEKKTPQG